MRKHKNDRIIGYRLPASSILEVVVAMVLIIIIFGVGIMVFNNVTQSSYSYQQFKASLLCREEYNKTIREKTFFDSELAEDNLTLVKKITSYKGSKDIILFEMQVKDATDRILAEKKSLIPIDK